MNQVAHESPIFEEMSTWTRTNQLFKRRSIFLSEAVSSSTAKWLISDLLVLDSESNDPIYLYVNSPGGEVNSGFAIFDTIRFIKSPVKVLTAGLCASIATIINVAVKPDNRYSLPNSRFLIHQPLIRGHLEGTAADLEIHSTQIMATRAKLNKILADECKQPLEKVEEDTKRDYWMSAEEAKKYGLITHIITNRGELS